MDQPIEQWTCTVCGAANAPEVWRCAACYILRCRVCRLPIYLDESLHADALGVEHMRCSDGEIKVRRAGMGQPRRVTIPIGGKGQ